jgi:uncharacterized protein YbbC (DUF1343 family)
MPYVLPIKPSPNLPNHRSIMLYPSICLFEGTHVSLGRGTNKQFQQIGIPGLENVYTYSFTPSPNEGAKDPPQNGKACYGLDLSDIDIDSIHTEGSMTYQYIIDFYEACKKVNIDFFIDNNFFDKLAGNTKIKQMIIEGKGNDEIKQSYQQELDEFKIVREKYLLY